MLVLYVYTQGIFTSECSAVCQSVNNACSQVINTYIYIFVELYMKIGTKERKKIFTLTVKLCFRSRSKQASKSDDQKILEFLSAFLLVTIFTFSSESALIYRFQLNVRIFFNIFISFLHLQ